MHRKREKNEYIVHNVELAFDILFLLARYNNLTLREIEDKLNVYSYQIEKILDILSRRGYVQFDKKTETYSLGIKNFEIGHSYLTHIEIRKQAKPFLQKLGVYVKENVYLAVRSGWEIVYIDAYEVDKPVIVKSRVGKLLPMYASASGKVHLAFMEKDELEEFFKDVELKPYTSKTITDKNMLLKHLEEVRERGYAIDDEEWEKEVRCFSVPVRDYTCKVAAAITLSAPSYRLPFERIEQIKERFIKAAEELSERLGYTVEEILVR